MKLTYHVFCKRKPSGKLIYRVVNVKKNEIHSTWECLEKAKQIKLELNICTNLIFDNNILNAWEK